MKQPHSPSERGWVVVTVAILLVVLLAFAALATDVGVLYSSRTIAQEVVDAAALSGASTFVLNPTAPQPATAIQYATAAATGQSILGKAVLAGDLTVSVDLNNNLVTVNLTRQEDTYFARAFGVDSAEVAVEGKAEASDQAVGARCVKPFFLPNTVLLPESSTTCDACDASKPEYSQVVIRGGAITAWAISRLGDQFRLRPTEPSRVLQPGQFYSLAIAGQGASVYRENIATCQQQGVYCNDCYLVEPGNMVGPTNQGVRDLVGDPADEFHDVGDYGPNHSDTSRSLVIVPVWDVCSDTPVCGEDPFCPAGRFPGGGRYINIQVVGFALVFVDGTQGADVVGRLINVLPCAGGGGAGGGGQIGTYAVPIRLVRES